MDTVVWNSIPGITGVRRPDPNSVRITCANDWSISLVWGPRTYSDNRNVPVERRLEQLTSSTCEIAVFDPTDEFFPFEGDEILGWVDRPTAERLIRAVASGDVSSLEAIAAGDEAASETEPKRLSR